MRNNMQSIDTQNIQAFESYMLRRNECEGTAETYVGHLRRLYRFLTEQGLCPESVDGHCLITGEMLDRFDVSQHTRNLKPETRNNYLAAFRKYFTYLLNLNRIDTDPTPILSYIRVEYDPYQNQDYAYSDEQLLRLLRTIGLRHGLPALRSRAYVYLALATAMRVSELCSLTVDDVPAIRDGAVVSTVKGGHKLEIAVAPFAIDPLMDYLAVRPSGLDTKALFVTNQGTALGRKQAHDHIGCAQDDAEIPKGTHKIRHTTVSRVNRIGGDAMSRDVAGHSVKNVTGRYTHTTVEERRAAISQVYQKLIRLA